MVKKLVETYIQTIKYDIQFNNIEIGRARITALIPYLPNLLYIII